MTEKGFELGQVVATPGALKALPEGLWILLIERHSTGDWGDLSSHDRKANDEAVRCGSRILSAYIINSDKPAGDGSKIWIITEADRSVTTILLPEEY